MHTHDLPTDVFTLRLIRCVQPRKASQYQAISERVDDGASASARYQSSLHAPAYGWTLDHAKQVLQKMEEKAITYFEEKAADGTGFPAPKTPARRGSV